MSKYVISFTAMLVFLTGCNENKREHLLKCGSLNLMHLDHLYAEVTLSDGSTAGIVHIYSEYPGYTYNIEPQEGFACADDVARAVVLLANCPEDNRTESRNIMLDKMVDFLLYMQSDSGYFYNFIWNDGSINKEYRTSLALPDWWSWRSFWALEEYAGMSERDVSKIEKACNKLAEKIFEDFTIAEKNLHDADGILLPTWLPGNAAADQAGVMILALEKYYDRTRDDRAVKLISRLAEGILVMQAGDSLNFPYGAFLSWNNIWHAYGNIQSYALLRAGTLLSDTNIVEKALIEVDYFYPWLMDNGFLNYFSLLKREGIYEIEEQEKYPQIAYGLRPVVYACAEAYRITGNKKYLNMAKEAAGWFAGNNLAGRKMWDPETGRCYDGIVSEHEINMNSGAESTIEALLSLQEMQNLGINIETLYGN